LATFILGIESSCDDTSAAVIDETCILSNVIANQDVHQKFGGVVPELASRAHQQNIIPVIDHALRIANINKNQLNAIAYTNGPGLLGSLLVGTSFAKAFALALGIPLIQVDHINAHVLAHFLQKKDETRKVPSFPFLCLLVSGGHTQIVKVTDHFSMEILGNTIDDAAGEAFDKTAKILGLPYPGGPLIDKYAKKGNPKKFKFPHPVAPGLNFSFSGLKTSILYFLRDEMKKDSGFIENNVNDLCASVQYTIVSILMKKLESAVKQTGITQVAVAGGVSANSELRNAFMAKQEAGEWESFIPPFEFCTDNAAMIAVTGYFKYLKSDFSSQDSVPYSRSKNK
jgi:N6-L-threonylcarbamoyladenine synthase